MDLGQFLNQANTFFSENSCWVKNRYCPSGNDIILIFFRDYVPI